MLFWFHHHGSYAVGLKFNGNRISAVGLPNARTSCLTKHCRNSASKAASARQPDRFPGSGAVSCVGWSVALDKDATPQSGRAMRLPRSGVACRSRRLHNWPRTISLRGLTYPSYCFSQDNNALLSPAFIGTVLQRTLPSAAAPYHCFAALTADVLKSAAGNPAFGVSAILLPSQLKPALKHPVAFPLCKMQGHSVPIRLFP